jgi:hypothetical protein
VQIENTFIHMLQVSHLYKLSERIHLRIINTLFISSRKTTLFIDYLLVKSGSTSELLLDISVLLEVLTVANTGRARFDNPSASALLAKVAGSRRSLCR